MTDIRFYDTCSLLIAGELLFDEQIPFVVSSITFKELERIKTSSNKDPETKYSARLLLRLFEQHPECYDVVIHKINYEQPLVDMQLDVTDDTRILMDAYWYANNVCIDEVIFVTNDLSLKHIANLFFGDSCIESIQEEQDTYTGYLEVIATDDVLAEFYQDSSQNYFDLKVGEYLILKDLDNQIVDLRAWTPEGYRYLKYDNFNSKWFGKITPYRGDAYQKLLFDSLSNNKITMVKGPAGSGKTLISLGFLMSQLEKGYIDRIVVFCNTVVTANSAKLGSNKG